MRTRHKSIAEVLADYLSSRQWATDLRVSFDWLLHYQRRDLPYDLIAGLTVAVMLIPQSMAYALLAGLPPVVGLYASILPILIYGLLGSTGIMTLGPTAITSVMTLSIIAPLAANNPEQMPLLAVTLAFCVGMVYLLLAFLRIGFLIHLLSHPVLVGYVNAAALIIAVSQLQHLFGVQIVNAAQPHLILLRTLSELPQSNLMTLAIGTGAIALLLFFKTGLNRLLGRLALSDTLRLTIVRSGPLFVSLVGTLLVYGFQLNETWGVEVIGTIPSGFLPLNTDFDFKALEPLLLGAIAIAFVGFMEDVSTAKALTQGQHQKINANHEMLAMGAANIAAAVTGGMPVTTSISRSAVNKEAGARTGLSSIIAAVMLLLTVLFLTPIFYYLPRAILAAIILTSVVNLIKPREFMQLWQLSQMETIIAGITLIAVLLVSIQLGLLLGVGLMIALYVYRSARPDIFELGRLGYSELYIDIADEDTMPIPNVTIIKINESLYFANAEFLDQYLRNTMAEREEAQFLILDCSAVNTIDASAVQILEGLVETFQDLAIDVFIAGLKGRVYSRVQSAQLQQMLGAGRFFDTTHDAVFATGQLLDDELPI